MYKRVETNAEKIEFKRLFSLFTVKEAGYQYFDEEGVEQYLLFQQGNAIGTIEFGAIKTNCNFTLMESIGMLDNPFIKEVAHQNIHIIGKLSLKKEYRGRGYFLNLLEIAYDYKLKNNIDWYTGVLNKPVYEMLNNKGFSAQQISAEITIGDITVVPFLLDIRQAEKMFLKMKNLKERSQKQKVTI